MLNSGLRRGGFLGLTLPIVMSLSLASMGGAGGEEVPGVSAGRPAVTLIAHPYSRLGDFVRCGSTVFPASVRHRTVPASTDIVQAVPAKQSPRPVAYSVIDRSPTRALLLISETVLDATGSGSASEIVEVRRGSPSSPWSQARAEPCAVAYVSSLETSSLTGRLFIDSIAAVTEPDITVLVPEACDEQTALQLRVEFRRRKSEYFVSVSETADGVRCATRSANPVPLRFRIPARDPRLPVVLLGTAPFVRVLWP